MSTAHEPAYTHDGMPKDRYRAYHVEKAKGGIGLTMIGGSAVVAPDSPQAFGNILLYKDEVVGWLKALADDVHAHGAAVMIQITHLGRRTSWAKDDWLPILAPCHIREPAHRAFPKAMEDFDIARVVTAYADAAERVQAAGLDGLEIEAYGHLVDQFWSPLTNQRDDEYGGVARKPYALRHGGAARDPRARRRRISSSACAWFATRTSSAASTRPRALAIARPAGGERPDRLRQRHSRPHRHRGRASPASFPAWASARRRISTSPAKSARRRGCRPSTPRACRTSPPRATPSNPASSISSA